MTASKCNRCTEKICWTCRLKQAGTKSSRPMQSSTKKLLGYIDGKPIYVSTQEPIRISHASTYKSNRPS